MRDQWKTVKGPWPPLLAALALACAPAAGAATSAVAHVTRFDIVSHGMTVGQARLVRASALRDGKACLETRLVTESRVDLLFFKFALAQDETWISDADGLIAYRLDRTENGRRTTVVGERRGGGLHFEIAEEGKTRSWTAPRGSFGLLAGGQPAPPLAAGAVTNVAVLDPAAGAISERVYRGTGQAALKIGGRELVCDTVAVEGPGLRLRRWVVTDDLGPLVLREEGHEKRGAYSRRAVSLEPEPPAAGGAPHFTKALSSSLATRICSFVGRGRAPITILPVESPFQALARYQGAWAEALRTVYQ